jgi:hypothetical protein
MDHPPSSTYLALNDLLLFPRIQSALRDEYFRMLKTSEEISDDSENYSITGVPKIFLTVAA